MEIKEKTVITVEVLSNVSVAKAWKHFTEPESITKWNAASDDWHSPRASNDVRPGGKFNIRMESRDGKEGFDFEGEYTNVIPNQFIAYTMPDGRQVSVKFIEEGHQTRVVESFDAESTHPAEMQREGWQAILDNFSRYAEAN